MKLLGRRGNIFPRKECKPEDELVKSLSEIKENIRVIDNYLKSHDKQEVDYAKERIKSGTCFITVADDNGYRFYPCKFIGYANNNMDEHERKANNSRSGIETRDRISELLGDADPIPPIPDENLEEKYKDYCESLGFKANETGAFGAERKYWILSE